MNVRYLANSTVLLPVIALCFGAGCAHVPEPVAAPNGQPLSIREHTETRQYTTKEKVGEVEYKNSSGQKVATADVYQNRVHVEDYQVWNAYQGNERISDDDLYRIAKDERAVTEVRDKRESGVFLNRLGVGTMIVGAVATGVGYFLMSRATDTTAADGTTTTNSSAAPMGVFYGGLVTLSVGGILTWIGVAKAKREHPLDQHRAMQAADNYNGMLFGRTGGATTTGGSVGP